MEKKKAKMAEDKLGMEPAVHRKELEKRISKLESLIVIFAEMSEDISKMEEKVNKICIRMGITKL